LPLVPANYRAEAAPLSAAFSNAAFGASHASAMYIDAAAMYIDPADVDLAQLDFLPPHIAAEIRRQRAASLLFAEKRSVADHSKACPKGRSDCRFVGELALHGATRHPAPAAPSGGRAAAEAIVID
jgi:hypothetical protein